MGGFDISLGLGLGLSDQSSCMMIHDYYSSQKEEDDPCNKPYPSLTLGPSSDDHANYTTVAKTESDVSSFSNSFSIKRERDQFTGDELEPEAENNNIPSNGNPSSTRKKLRLTKEQSAVLEDTFKQHSVLHQKQKQELARKLDLETRQVEVWFQNRRARTKLKQTEVECGVLKKWYEKLTEENKKLEKELKELKSMKTTPREEPFYMQLPVASQTVCPCCKRNSGGGSGGEMSNNGSSTPPSLAQCPIIISIRSPNLLRLPS